MGSKQRKRWAMNKAFDASMVVGAGKAVIHS